MRLNHRSASAWELSIKKKIWVTYSQAIFPNWKYGKEQCKWSSRHTKRGSLARRGKDFCTIFLHFIPFTRHSAFIYDENFSTIYTSIYHLFNGDLPTDFFPFCRWLCQNRYCYCNRKQECPKWGWSMMIHQST